MTLPRHFALLGGLLGLALLPACQTAPQAGQPVPRLMLETVASEWTELPASTAAAVTRESALARLRELGPVLREGNSEAPFTTFEAGPDQLALEWKAGRREDVSVWPVDQPRRELGFSDPIVSISSRSAFILWFYEEVPLVEERSSSYRGFTAQAGLPYRAIRAATASAEPGSAGRGAVILDLEGGAYLFFLTPSAEEARGLRDAFLALR